MTRPPAARATAAHRPCQWSGDTSLKKNRDHGKKRNIRGSSLQTPLADPGICAIMFRQGAIMAYIPVTVLVLLIGLILLGVLAFYFFLR